MFVLDSVLLFFIPAFALVFYILFIIFKSFANIVLSLIDIIKPAIMIVLMFLVALAYFFLAGYLFSSEHVFSNKISGIVVALGFGAILLIVGAGAYLHELIKNDNVTIDSFILRGLFKLFDGIATFFENVFKVLMKTMGEHIRR